MECRAAGSLLSALDVGAAAPPRGLPARHAVFLFDSFVPRDVKSLFEEVLARTQEASLSSPSSPSRSARGASRPALPKHSPTRRQRRKSAGFRGSDRDHVDYVCPPRRDCAATTDSACRLGVCTPCVCAVCARAGERARGVVCLRTAAPYRVIVEAWSLLRATTCGDDRFERGSLVRARALPLRVPLLLFPVR